MSGGLVDPNPKLSLTVDEAIEINEVSLFQYRLLFITGCIFMADSLEFSLLSFITVCVTDDFSLSTEQEATLAASVFIGYIIGALFWGRISSRFGRRNTCLFSNAIVFIGGIISGAAPGYVSLLLFRGIVGFGVAASFVAFDLLGEVIPSSHRGMYLIYIELFWALGSILSTGLAWAILPSSSWRVLCYSAALPMAVVLLLSYIYLPESPKWLMKQKRIKEAEDVIVVIAKTNGTTLELFELVDSKDSDNNNNNNSYKNDDDDYNLTTKTTTQRGVSYKETSIIYKSSKSEKNNDNIINEKLVTTTKSEGRRKAVYWDLINNNNIRKITIPMWFIQLLFGFSLTGLTLFTTTKIYSTGSNNDDKNNTCDFNYSALLIISTADFIGVIITTKLINIFDRIRLQYIFYFISAITVFICGFPLPAALLLLFTYSSRLFLKIASDVTRLRSYGHGSCIFMNKIGSFVSSYLVLSNLTFVEIGLSLGLINTTIGIIVFFFLPETRNNNYMERQDTFFKLESDVEMIS